MGAGSITGSGGIEAQSYPPSLRGALATKQSILSFHCEMDCFAALAMTVPAKLARGPARYAEPLILFRRVLFENAFVQRYQPACKPGFVGHRRLAQAIRDGHSSGTLFAQGLEQPTRTASLTSPCGVIALQRTSRVAVSIRFCSRCGLPCRFRCRTRGALLPHLFTLTAPKPREERRRAVRSLWHCPWGRPRRTLSGTVCRWSPDFPLPQPFGWCGSGRPAD